MRQGISSVAQKERVSGVRFGEIDGKGDNEKWILVVVAMMLGHVASRPRR